MCAVHVGPSVGESNNPGGLIEVVPDALWARVHEHHVETRDGLLACRTFESVGTTERGGRDVVITLPRDLCASAAELPDEVRDIFCAVAAGGAKGTWLGEGDQILFGEGRLFGSAGLDRVLLVRHPPLRGAPVRLSPLEAQPIFADEGELANRQGYLRVMARLGERDRFFPWPPWVAPSRPSVATSDERSSLLERTERLPLWSGFAVLDGDRAVLRLNTRGAQRVRSTLGALDGRAPMLMLTGSDPTADACLVWRPGQAQPQAITPHASNTFARASANFIVLVPKSDNDRVTVIEDGIAVGLRDESWARLRASIEREEPFQIDAPPGDIGFSVEFIVGPLVRLLDGATLVSQGGVAVTSAPHAKHDAPTVVAACEMVMLLLPEQEMFRRISPHAFAELTRTVVGAVRAFVEPLGPSTRCDLLLEVDVDRGRIITRSNLRPAGAALDGDALDEQLAALPAPPLSGVGPISFCLVMRLWGGTGAPLPHA